MGVFAQCRLSFKVRKGHRVRHQSLAWSDSVRIGQVPIIHRMSKLQLFFFQGKKYFSKSLHHRIKISRPGTLEFRHFYQFANGAFPVPLPSSSNLTNCAIQFSTFRVGSSCSRNNGQHQKKLFSFGPPNAKVKSRRYFPQPFFSAQRR